MPHQARNSEDKETFYHVQIIDAELGKIRFGPMLKDAAWTPEEVAQKLREDIESVGLVTALTKREIWGGLNVVLTGDDGTKIPVWELPPPGIK